MGDEEIVEDDEFLQATMGSMDLVYNIARRMVPRREDAEDLVQETYLAAYRAWQDHRRPRRVEPWMATICLNLGRSLYRQRARRPAEVPLEEWTHVASAADPEASAIAELDREAVHRALRAINEDQRVAITLVDLAGFSVKETARIMRTPPGTVLSRLHRGRQALVRLLDDRSRDRSREAEE